MSVGKDAYELVTGKNLVTGKELSGFERGLAAVGILSLGAGDTVLGIGKGVVRVGARMGEELAPFVRAGGEIFGSARVFGIKTSETLSKYVSEFRRIVGNNVGALGYDIEEVAQRVNRALHERYLEQLRREM